ncbi:hypothetical protein DFR50_111129 [Roseiarcus fermentans]|uniref:Cyclase dehydrase n=1 Tax=Roseiarcus fermentans TaxID=1473586 RepID=A0A366FGY5_9HYPH|nr:hypothetical protein [Roseiarcus fermentans]RBP13867.1 hypothetical protein DFR50_111129 [Roseiarcus fermentans]
MSLANLSRIARAEGDPKVLQTGRSSLPTADRVARSLGWFSIALGLTELFAPGAIARTLGLDGRKGLVRAYGAREIGAGVVSLSTERSLGLWSRVAGDALDLATLAPALGRDNPKRRAAALAFTLVAGVALIDVVAAGSATAVHARAPNRRRNYRDRSGFPQGVAAARGAAAALRAHDDLATARRLPAGSEAKAPAVG